MEVNLILLTPDALMLGFQYHRPEKNFNFDELNLYLLFFQIQLRW